MAQLFATVHSRSNGSQTLTPGIKYPFRRFRNPNSTFILLRAALLLLPLVQSALRLPPPPPAPRALRRRPLKPSAVCTSLRDCYTVRAKAPRGGTWAAVCAASPLRRRAGMTQLPAEPTLTPTPRHPSRRSALRSRTE